MIALRKRLYNWRPFKGLARWRPFLFLYHPSVTTADYSFHLLRNEARLMSIIQEDIIENGLGPWASRESLFIIPKSSETP